MVQVGAVIAIIEIEGANTAAEKVETAQPEPAQKIATEAAIPGISQLPAESQPAAANIDFKASERFYSPLVKNIAKEEGVSLEELDTIKGSGADGRLTKEDLLNHIKAKKVVLQPQLELQLL